MNKFLIALFFSSLTAFAQQTDIVDFLNINATVNPNAAEKSITGTVKCSFKVLQKTDSIFLDAKNMKIISFALEGIVVKAGSDKIWLLDNFEAGKTYTAFFTYEAEPKQTLYFFGNEIWTQGQGKYTSHWLPSMESAIAHSIAASTTPVCTML